MDGRLLSSKNDAPFRMTKAFAAIILSITPLFSAMSSSISDSLPDQVTVVLADEKGQPLPPKSVPTVKKTDEEWLTQLGPERYKILRAQGTEIPFCGLLLDNKKKGIYFCAGCDLPLFSSDAKFHSGTGWPSFFQPFARENVLELRDTSHGMIRTEIRCARCGGHLGHVFEDGPKPTNLRYCLNSESLVFREFPAKGEH